MKRIRVIIPVLVIMVALIFLSGYRFTALSAANNHAFLSSDAELIDQYKIGSSGIFIFKSEEENEYRTVMTEKSGLLFSGNQSTFIPYNSDELQLVGAASFINDKDEASFISFKSNDDKVAYIEAGVEPHIERKEIKKEERVSFLFPFSEQINFLYPTAFDKDGNELYYFGFPKDSNMHNQDDLRWHKTGD